tara:strand:- start:11084 stop:11248 length:165 start_codon:yes stop_codon:yes gene_type:complete
MARRFNYSRLAQQDRMRQNGWERFEPDKKAKKTKRTNTTKKRLPPLIFEWDPQR